MTLNANSSIKAAVAPVAVTQANGGSADRAPLIRLEGLTKSYNEAGAHHLVLDALDREFYAGEFVCLVGRSGSGKSTLLNLISGIDAPSAGDVTIYPNGAGAPVHLTTLSEQERTLFRRRSIGIVFQFFNLIPTLTVLENVTLPLELNGEQRGVRERATALLAACGAGQPPRFLPRQAQRRRAAARGHCPRPGA